MTGESSTEAKLASIELGRTTVPRTLVASFDEVFRQLEAKCTQGRDTMSGNRPGLSDIAVGGVRILRGEGKAIDHLEFLRALRDSIPEGSPKLDCVEIAAALMAMLSPK